MVWVYPSTCCAGTRPLELRANSMPNADEREIWTQDRRALHKPRKPDPQPSVACETGSTNHRYLAITTPGFMAIGHARTKRIAPG